MKHPLQARARRFGGDVQLLTLAKGATPAQPAA
jgi:hypothetical protein